MLTQKDRTKRVTLADVARRAGVSVSTASAVLGRRPHCYASEQTKQQVIDAARHVGYRPNLLARSLRGEKTRTIGLVMFGLDVGPVGGGKLQSIEDEAWRQDYRLLIGTHKDDRARLRAYVDEFLNRAVDGLIYMPSVPEDGELIREARNAGVSVVTVEAPAEYDAPDVRVDREMGGYLQVKHLLDIGRRKLAFIFTSHRSHTGGAKVRGIERALKEAGLDLRDFPVIEDPRPGNTAPAGTRLTQQLLDQGAAFDGLITLSDNIAASAVTTLVRSGRRVPEDVAVVGFDDAFEPDGMMIPLTTIRQPRQIGAPVFELLLSQIRGEDQGDRPTRLALPPQLVVRRSTVPDA